MTHQRADRLLEDFHRHCRGQATFDVDKILSGIVLQSGTDHGPGNSVANALENALLLSLKAGWDPEPAVTDALVAYCDYFTPSIRLINAASQALPEMLERMVGLHCSDSRNSPRYDDYNHYVKFLRSDKIPTHLAVAIMNHLVVRCADNADTNKNFPLHHVITVTARYELKDCLSAHQQKILELESGSSVGFRRSEIAWGIKLHEIGLKEIAQKIFEISDAVPRGRDLIWLKDTFQIAPKQSWQERCWESLTAGAVEAIVRYYIEVGGIEFPAEKEVHPAHLCDALMEYTHRFSEHENERFGPLIDYLAVKSEGQSRPRYESLPKKMLEQSSLYMELKLQDELGL